MGFLAGTLVRTQDNGWTPIEEVRAGIGVRSRGAEVNRVAMLSRVPLAGRPVLRFRGVGVSPEHLFFTTDGPKAFDPDAYRREAGRVRPVEFEDGTLGFKVFRGIDPEKVRRLGPGDRIVGLGVHLVTYAEPVQEEHPADTTLYNLVADNSHTFLAGGMLCGGWERDDDFDYEEWRYRSS